jgi:glycosyltransferase involved in cell wall biosynthesis
MKILFIAPNYLPHIGGVEKHLQNLCEEMLQDGHNITILVMKHDNSYEDYEKNGNFEINRLNKSDVRFGNRINFTKYMIVNFAKLLKYDLIHFHDFGTFWTYCLPVWLPLKLFSKKMFVTFHGWEGDVPPRKSVILKRKIVEKLADGNICIGHFISKWYGTKADIVSYGGVDIVADLSQNKEKYLLFVGRLAPDTGISDYIKAWEIISNKYPNLHFIVCGDGVLKADIEKYVKNNNISNIAFEGFVSDVESYIKDAKVIFTAGYLGILEAFSYKKSLIATYDNELKKDYLQMIPNYDEMMWVVDNEIENIAKAVDEAINDETKKEKAYNYSLHNSWEKVKEDYYRLWNK